MTGLSGYRVKDESGRVLAYLYEVNGVLRVVRTPECSIGDYFRILTFLQEFGYNAR